MKFPQATLNEWQGLLSLGCMALYGWASFFFPGVDGRPLLAPWPLPSLFFAILFTIVFFRCAFSPAGRAQMSVWLAWAGGAFGLFIAFVLYKKGPELLLEGFFWAYLKATATALRRPIDSLALALLTFGAMTLAHFCYGSEQLGFPWWYFPLVGIFLIFTTYAVLLRTQESRRELEKHQQELIAQKAEAETLLLSMQALVQKLETSELQERNYSQQLEESNQNLQEFAYVISHDLREPLRTITAYTQLLKRYLRPEDQSQAIQEFMHFIVDAAKRMDGQINGLLEYSRVGRAALQLEPLVLSEIWETIGHLLNAQIRETGATLELSGSSPTVWADKMQIVLVLQNLVSNALKYRKPEEAPLVRLEAYAEGNFWKIGVHDNGMGIEERYLENIFGVFRRLHTRSDIEGSGIGLSICRRIVQRHGGKIWAESEFGIGTSFWFTLPQKESE